MKKLLTLAALIGGTALSFGQGQVTFNNSGTTLMSTNSVHDGAATGATDFTLNSFVYALFAAPSTVNTVTGANDGNWTFLGVYATNSSAATGGRLAGGQPILPSPYATTTTWNFIVRGWSTTIAGQSWSTAQSFEAAIEAGGSGNANQFFGRSGIATITVGGAPSLPSAAIFGTTAGSSIQGFTLNMVPVPEPSTFALAGLGMAAMLIFRRRKA
jgi:hypothetical protein